MGKITVDNFISSDWIYNQNREDLDKITNRILGEFNDTDDKYGRGTRQRIKSLEIKITRNGKEDFVRIVKIE